MTATRSCLTVKFYKSIKKYICVLMGIRTMAALDDDWLAILRLAVLGLLLALVVGFLFPGGASV